MFQKCRLSVWVPVGGIFDYPDDDVPLNDLVRQLNSRDSSVVLDVDFETVDDKTPTEATYDTKWERDLLDHYKRDRCRIGRRHCIALQDPNLTKKVGYKFVSVWDTYYIEHIRYLQTVEQQITMTADIIVKMKLATRHTMLSDFFSLMNLKTRIHAIYVKNSIFLLILILKLNLFVVFFFIWTLYLH